MLTINTIVRKPINEVWKAFTNKEDIMQWNAASEDWHTTNVDQDLEAGKTFNYRMEAKVGSMGFEFAGKYDTVTEGEKIEYTLDDGRAVSIVFRDKNGETEIEQSFEAEKQNAEELQKQGWQAILDNFKKYVEGDSAHKKVVTY